MQRVGRARADRQRGREQAAGNDERIEVGRGRRIERRVDADRLALLAVPVGFDLAGFQGDDDGFAARLLDRFLRLEQFRFLETVSGENGDAFA